MSRQVKAAQPRRYENVYLHNALNLRAVRIARSWSVLFILTNEPGDPLGRHPASVRRPPLVTLSIQLLALLLEHPPPSPTGARARRARQRLTHAIEWVHMSKEGRTPGTHPQPEAPPAPYR